MRIIIRPNVELVLWLKCSIGLSHCGQDSRFRAELYGGCLILFARSTSLPFERLVSLSFGRIWLMIHFRLDFDGLGWLGLEIFSLW
jgi:hypothetical protein